MIQNTGMIKKEQSNYDFILDCNLILKQFSILQHEQEFLVGYFEACLHGLETDEGRPEKSPTLNLLTTE